jgi:hypothetical protein
MRIAEAMRINKLIIGKKIDDMKDPAVAHAVSDIASRIESSDVDFKNKYALRSVEATFSSGDQTVQHGPIAGLTFYVRDHNPEGEVSERPLIHNAILPQVLVKSGSCSPCHMTVPMASVTPTTKVLKRDNKTVMDASDAYAMMCRTVALSNPRLVLGQPLRRLDVSTLSTAQQTKFRSVKRGDSTPEHLLRVTLKSAQDAERYCEVRGELDVFNANIHVVRNDDDEDHVYVTPSLFEKMERVAAKDQEDFEHLNNPLDFGVKVSWGNPPAAILGGDPPSTTSFRLSLKLEVHTSPFETVESS